MAGLRVLLADDSLLLREGLARLLEDAGCAVVATAADKPELLRKARGHRPDVAIIDVRMPPSHTDEGIDAALQIRRELPETAVLILAQNVEEHHALRLLGEETRRTGYLLKDRVADADALADAVRQVADGHTVLDPAVVSLLMQRHERASPLAGLTGRELEILGLAAEGRSNAAIGRLLFITENAVEKHITSIFAKLRIGNDANDHRRVIAVLRYLAETDRGPSL